MTRVVNIYREPYDILITRATKWGNRASHLPKSRATVKVNTREEAIEWYREWILDQDDLIADLESLRGKRLGCVCKPKDCHGDVLVELLGE